MRYFSVGCVTIFASIAPVAAQEMPPAAQTEKAGASAAETPDGASPAPAANDIVVTGSLIRGLPREFVASPVFSYGQRDIVRSGAGSVSEYMLSIPQNFTGDLSDFGSSASSIGNTLGSGTTNNQYDGFASASQLPEALLAQVQAIADIRSQNFAVETTDGIDLDVAYRTRLLGGDASMHLTGQYILGLSLKAAGGTAISRLDGYAQPADLRLNGIFVWGRDGFSGGTVVN